MHRAGQPMLCANCPSPGHVAIPPSFTPTPTSGPRTYADALLTPAAPSLPRSPPRSPIRSTAGCCFRCLSPRHPVRECRDPVCCRGCSASGHRLRECTMARPRPTLAQPPATASRPNSPANSPPHPASPYPFAMGGAPALRPFGASRTTPVPFTLGESSSAAVEPVACSLCHCLPPPAPASPP
jgi:hypothetical protein